MTRYELLDRIGVGGMAEIFRGKAVAAGGFEKPVAIKRILPHLSQDKRFVELLIAEAKVLSLLKHRNIVQIFDVGLGDDNQYFLVMEYVDGKDLGAVQRATEGKRMPFHIALHIGAEICEALEHAHSAKAPDGRSMSLVHRDVSPSNVLLSRAGEVKLTDFGIAKRAEAEQTRGGAVRGKFAYISPEQARNEHVEPRSDVFSAAILLWELVTGRRLFSGLGDLEALRAVRDPQIQPPSIIDPSVGRDFDALIMSALSKDIKRRPTAGQLGERLRSIRYSLEATGGDPATELAAVIDTAEQFERESSRNLSGFEAAPSTIKRAPQSTSGFEDLAAGGEATVIRIRTADEFGMLEKNPKSISEAKRVIDAFEDEETRLAQLSGDQMRLLRSSRAHRDSGEIEPPPPRGRRPTDEPTTARPPMEFADEDARTMAGARPGAPLPHESFDGDEATRLVAPTNRRTPPPERIKRAGTAPPRAALPGVTPHNPAAQADTHSQRGRPTGRPPDMPIGAGPPPMPQDPPPSVERDSWVPGTVHNRNPTATPDAMRIGPAPQKPPELEDSVPTPVTIAKSREAPSVSASMSASHSASQPRLPPPPSRPMPMQAQLPTPMPQPMQPMPLQPMQQPIPQPMQQPIPQPMQQPIPQPMQQPMPQPMLQQPAPMWPPQQPQMRPSTPDMFGQRPSTPGYRKPAPRSMLQPWMLVVGALIMAALAFLVTRAFIGK